nr:immunoglobulin heavy chain junction region [Macaca mulatta]MPN69372.1 immunoglobulin heavy chain junction region [Macaca mulatta]MPN69378.1 immunoglobulin heavy chain junction region [Macaca mulatta]MPN69385.1 immunoglobulin heavy chain junction region [Macaca mulatta]MPN69421.1 immunoglobulin heavy chain junction region [Macaca mulatta]
CVRCGQYSSWSIWYFDLW